MAIIQVPEAAGRIIETLNAHGYEAYVVGGCVRDSLLGRTPEDWDITTSAKPQEVKALFRRTIDTGILHGTVTVMEERVGYEVTTYRIDGEYEDGRHPKTVEFTRNLLEDLKRRDFTINAMAYSAREGLVDAFGGMEDLKKRCIRCVGNPNDRFSEDALRILRAIRFCAQLDFRMEENTRKALRAIAPNLAKVSRERIAVELTKLLVSGCPEQIGMVYQQGIAPYISRTFEQAGERLNDLEKLSLLSPKKHLRYAGFLRMEASSEAAKILKELKMDNETIRRVKVLVEEWRKEIPAKKPAIRRVMSRLSRDLYEDLLKLQEVFAPEEYQKQLNIVKQYSGEILEAGDCLCLKELAISGKELQEAGMKPGPELGNVLKELFEAVLDHPEWNTKERLFELFTQAREK